MTPHVILMMKSDEPLFLEEWERANAAVDLLGMSVSRARPTALNVFLRHFTEGMWGKDALAKVKRMGQKSWLANYRALYATKPSLDWNSSGADLGFIEEMILTRNTAQHGGDLYSTYTFQDGDTGTNSRNRHSAIQTGWAMVSFSARLLVTRERLHQVATPFGAWGTFWTQLAVRESENCGASEEQSRIESFYPRFKCRRVRSLRLNRLQYVIAEFRTSRVVDSGLQVIQDDR